MCPTMPDARAVAAEVLGYSCRLPESASPSQFWDNLINGRSCTSWLVDF